MSEILRGHNFLIRWHDAEQTIIVIEVLDRWTWDNAFYAISFASKAVRATPHDVYTIFWFKYEMPRLPDGLALPKLQELMMMQNPNEQFVFLITRNPLLKVFLELTSKMYGLNRYLARYRYVAAFENALTLIDKHKNPKPSQVE